MNKLIISHDQFRNYVSKICRQLAFSEWKPDYVVGITRGGLVPAVMISHYLNVPMYSLDVSLRDNDEDMGPESNLWMAEHAFGYVPEGPLREGIDKRSDATFKKKILLVDDINDTGATFNWIIEDWRSGCLPNDDAWSNVFNHNVRFAVIVDNLASKCEYGMDYVGLEINKSENDVWVEFPYEEWWAK